MPTFYDIARKTRNALPYMRDYKGGVGAGRSTPPAGMGQHMVESDYYAPDLSNQQYWFENADPSMRYGSYADALAATGGNPEVERKVAIANQQRAEQMAAQQRKLALELMQEQRLREANRMRLYGDLQRNMAVDRRERERLAKSDADRALSAYTATSAARYAKDPSPDRRTQLIRGYKGTPEQATAFGYLLDEAARKEKDYQDARADEVFREHGQRANIYERYLKNADVIGWEKENLFDGDLPPILQRDLEGTARDYNKQRDNFEEQSDRVIAHYNSKERDLIAARKKQAARKDEEGNPVNANAVQAEINGILEEMDRLKRGEPYAFLNPDTQGYKNPYRGTGRYSHRWDLDNLFKKREEAEENPLFKEKTPANKKATSDSEEVTALNVEPSPEKTLPVTTAKREASAFDPVDRPEDARYLDAGTAAISDALNIARFLTPEEQAEALETGELPDRLNPLVRDTRARDRIAVAFSDWIEKVKDEAEKLIDEGWDRDERTLKAAAAKVSKTHYDRDKQ